MQMQKRRFRIGDLAKQLEIDKFVIRFWEKEFTLSPSRSFGGQRFYDEKDFEKFKQIKTLLYEKKFTIAGAREQLKNQNQTPALLSELQKKSLLKYKNEQEKTIKSETENINGNIICARLDTKDFIQKAILLRENLIKLRNLL